MGQTVVPRTMDELLKEYDYYITGTIVKLASPIEPDLVQELKQQVYQRVLEFDCLNRYDASKARFTTYLFWIIRSVVVRNYERSLKNQAVPLVEVSEPDSVRRRLTATYIALADESLERQQEALDWCNRFEAHLTSRSLDTERCGPALVFRLLRQDVIPAEIARMCGMSRSYVSHCLSVIKAEARAFLSSQPEAPSESAVAALKDFGRFEWTTV